MQISTNIREQYYPHSLTNTLKKIERGLTCAPPRSSEVDLFRFSDARTPQETQSPTGKVRRSPTGSTRCGSTALQRHKGLDTSTQGMSGLRSRILTGKQLYAQNGLQLLSSTGLLPLQDPCFT